MFHKNLHVVRGRFRNLSIPSKRHFKPYSFASKTYWEQRYKKESRENVEWFLNPEFILPYLKVQVSKAAVKRRAIRLAHLGAGLSYLGIDLARCFPEIYVCNIDSSESAIQKMNSYLKANYDDEFCRRCYYLRRDILCTNMKDASFDFCIDKGTFDAVVRGGKEKSKTYLDEVNRLLVPGGSFIQISQEPPEIVCFADSSLWKDYRYKMVNDPAEMEKHDFEYWIYHMVK
uniref:Methyltransferase domain-containing protein n=1 Tax=Aplanochytrium stocchinoi TaxID=215587 RepID=A0A7S3LPG7_9STRA